MKDDNKTTKKQLLYELTELHSQNAALKESITASISAEFVAAESSRYAESIVETVREPLLVLDADLKIISANRNFYRTFKVTPGETIGSFIYDLGNKQWDIPRLRELLQEVLPKKEAFDYFEVDHNFQDIGHKIMLLNARQIYRKDTGTQLILLAIEDITERRLIEEKLLLVAIVQSSRDAIIGKSLDGIITSWNRGAKEIYGYTESEIIGKSISILVPPEMPEELTDILRKIKLGEVIERYETVRRRKDGQKIDVSITVSAINDAEGRIVGASTIARDITDRKRVEEALINSENKYRNIFENATEGIFQSTQEGRYISINPAFSKIGGYNSPDEMMESVTNIKKIYVHQEDRTRLLELLNKHNIVTNFEAEIRRRDNAIIWISMNVRVIRDRDHRIIFLEGTIQDITDRKRAEKALHESEDRYRSLYVDSRDAIMILSPERGFIAGNPAAVKLFACRDEQEFNKLSPELLSPEYQPDGVRSLDRSLEMIRLVLEKGSHFFEWTHRRADGTDFSATVLLSRIERSESQLIQATVRDITERKQAEEKLKDTLESLRKAVNTTIQVMVSAVEVRDPYTAGHQLRSADLARAIATEMGLPQKKVDGIRMAGSIHDIGKLSIPAEILSKPIKLTNLEFSLIKEHSRSGYEMLKDVESPWPLAEIVYQHHERMDGSGYPRNLKGDDILMEARIMAVADVVEAMASHRPYRAGLGIDAALSEIEKNRGIFYDDAVADACLRLFREKGYQLS